MPIRLKSLQFWQSQPEFGMLVHYVDGTRYTLFSIVKSIDFFGKRRLGSKTSKSCVRKLDRNPGITPAS